jgi:hypothetical protein
MAQRFGTAGAVFGGTCDIDAKGSIRVCSQSNYF